MSEEKNAAWQVRVGTDWWGDDCETVPVRQLSEADLRRAAAALDEDSRGGDPYSSTVTQELGKRARRIDDMRKLDAEIRRARGAAKAPK